MRVSRAKTCIPRMSASTHYIAPLVGKQGQVKAILAASLPVKLDALASASSCSSPAAAAAA